MAVTSAQIAALAGVSRGTVDRALNDRGRVNPEVAERIKKIAAELGYQPNPAGKALAMAKHPYRIGVVVQSCETAFMQLLLEGIEVAREKLEKQGAKVYVRQIEKVDAAKQLAVIEELVNLGIEGMAIAPVDDERICAAIDTLAEKMPVVTFNTDMPDSNRMCFVGQDSTAGGCACAGLMDMMLDGQGKVLMITGYPSNRSHNQRCDGFAEEIRKEFPAMELLPLEKCYDNNDVCYEIVRDAFKVHPDIRGIYLSANGQVGACRALQDLGLARQVRLICYDLTPQNKANTQNGTIDFLIGQNADLQGERPSEILFEYLFTGKKPQEELLYTGIVIKTKYNL